MNKELKKELKVIIGLTISYTLIYLPYIVDNNYKLWYFFPITIGGLALIYFSYNYLKNETDREKKCV